MTNNSITINTDNAFDLINSTKGKIFKALFTKKDGSLREMVCRLGVHKYITGVGRSYEPKDYGLIGVYDMQNNGYRMINLKTLQSLTINGKNYEVA